MQIESRISFRGAFIALAAVIVSAVGLAAAGFAGGDVRFGAAQCVILILCLLDVAALWGLKRFLGVIALMHGERSDADDGDVEAPEVGGMTVRMVKATATGAEGLRNACPDLTEEQAERLLEHFHIIAKQEFSE